jgi:hypothetical protein
VFVVGAVSAAEAVVTQGGAKVIKGFGDGGGVGCGWAWHKKGVVGGDARVDPRGKGGLWRSEAARGRQ